MLGLKPLATIPALLGRVNCRILARYAILATICSAEHFTEMEEFGIAK